MFLPPDSECPLPRRLDSFPLLSWVSLEALPVDSRNSVDLLLLPDSCPHQPDSSLRRSLECNPLLGSFPHQE